MAFARDYPERFRLVFNWHRLNHEDPALRGAGEAAFEELEAAIRLAAGAPDDPLQGDLLTDLIHAWSLVHGFSHLLLAGQLGRFGGNKGERAFSDLLESILERLHASAQAELAGAPKQRR